MGELLPNQRLVSRVIAEYKGTEANGYDLDRTFVFGNGYDEVLAMFIAEDELDQTGFDMFLEFVDTWLCVDPNDTCYDATYDDNDDDIVDYADFAAFADDFDIPTGRETDYYYLRDALGSVMGLVGGKYGRPEDREFYNYDVYGKPVLPNEQESKSQNPYQFAGMRFDAEIERYHTLYRTYSPTLGRWLQHDPIGTADSMNLYEYVSNNPTTFVDPLV